MNTCKFCQNKFDGNRCPRCGSYVPQEVEIKQPENIEPHLYSDVKIKFEKKSQLQPPSLVQKAKNLSKAVVKHAMDGFKNVQPEFQKKRLEICRSCDRYNEDNKTCNECGCYVEIKTKWASERCPIGKWEREETTSPGGIIMPPKGGCGGCGGKNGP